MTPTPDAQETDLLAGPLAEALNQARASSLAGDHLAAAGWLVEAAWWSGLLPSLVPLIASQLGLDLADFEPS